MGHVHSTGAGAGVALSSPTRPPPLSEDALPGQAAVTQSLAAEQAAELREALGRLVKVLSVANPLPFAPEGKQNTATYAAPDAEVGSDDDSTGDAEPGASAMEGTEAFLLTSPVSMPLTDSSADRAAALLLLEPFHELHLAGYLLGDAALTAPNGAEVPAFLSVVRQHTCLRVLDLSFNSLTPAIIGPLIDAVRDLPGLEVLKLSGNPLGTTTTTTGTATGEGNPADSANSAQDWDLTTVNIESPKPRVTAPTGHQRRSQTTTQQQRQTSLTSLTSASSHAASMSPAAQLGRWLASNPPLQQLALFHCDLTDGDVRVLLAGLIAPRNTNLRTLQLAWNPACTTRSAQMALQLVTELGNTTLSTVELETAAPVATVRLEYACTPQGVFRSGHTLIPADDADDATPVTESDPVDLEQLRALQQLLPTLPSRLASAKAARYLSRCRFLRVDLDGTRVFNPLVTRELADVLRSRPRPRTAPESSAAYAAAAPELDRVVKSADAGQDGCTVPSPAVSDPSPAIAQTESAAADGVDAATDAGAAADDADELDTVDDVIDEVQDKHQDGQRHVSLMVQGHEGTADAAAATLAPSFGGLSPHPPGGDRRPRTSPPLHLQRDRLVSMSSRGSGSRASRTSSAAAYHHFHYKRQPMYNRSPQELRDARFESPQRLAGVMADAVAFRDRQHPHDRDPLAPPSAEVSRRNREHGGHGPAVPFYEPDAFVLRSNGLTKVLVAPVRPNGEMPFHNVDLEDVPDRRLRACWCTPRQTSSTTGIFAGTLHYHCVHEGTAAAVQQQQQKLRGKSAGGGNGGGCNGPSSRHNLPALHGKQAQASTSQKGIGFSAAADTITASANGAGAVSEASAAAATAAPGHTDGTVKVYRGCQGTGHDCLSRTVAATEVGHGYRGRMRAALNAVAARPTTSSGVGAGSERGSKEARAATAGSRMQARRQQQQHQPDRARGHFLDWSSSDEDESDATSGRAAAVALPMKVRTVHTTSSGVSVSLNYNPVAHFSATHVGAAAGMTLSEF